MRDINLEDSIEKLEFTARTANCLEAEHVDTVGELLLYTGMGLLNIPNFGRHSLGEVEEVLGNHGLCLRMKGVPTAMKEAVKFPEWAGVVVGIVKYQDRVIIACQYGVFEVIEDISHRLSIRAVKFAEEE